MNKLAVLFVVVIFAIFMVNCSELPENTAKDTKDSIIAEQASTIIEQKEKLHLLQTQLEATLQTINSLEKDKTIDGSPLVTPTVKLSDEEKLQKLSEFNKLFKDKIADMQESTKQSAEKDRRIEYLSNLVQERNRTIAGLLEALIREKKKSENKNSQLDESIREIERYKVYTSALQSKVSDNRYKELVYKELIQVQDDLINKLLKYAPKENSIDRKFSNNLVASLN